ncbi:HIT domain-containing protein [Glaciecola siphonariae]|uniref:HIT domain-containing protein n=1 Tax=Glaciecola siphonariae TaxID=521012 RepID=A0ABV9LSS2_9ALTE
MSSEMDFKLHPQLIADSMHLARLDLCEVRIINDANYPWFLLVPQRNGLVELHDLTLDEQQLLTIESRLLSGAIINCFAPDKLNVASIGNMVSQLHVHHIARFKTDLAWPKPVWGLFEAKPYEQGQLSERIESMHTCLKANKGSI